MRNYDGLFTEFAVKLSFPSYFGRNFNALEDSLTDLPWLRPGACVLWITEASRVLELERPDDRIALVRLLDRVCREWNRAVDEGKAWDRPAIPFHVMLEAEGAGEGVSRLLSEAGPEYSELSLT